MTFLIKKQMFMSKNLDNNKIFFCRKVSKKIITLTRQMYTGVYISCIYKVIVIKHHKSHPPFKVLLKKNHCNKASVESFTSTQLVH
jgi:hypothetical protein